ncbi:unnamed protein product [Paramecium pentaurelia]|uniref:Uncharacterized protein n=1 Tax=Paramecium pentaurelia TaxID=43138 RepID=A0A8S1YH27_9CILI|nr:unnamed protein product [Paramecium pentaurelia]
MNTRLPSNNMYNIQRPFKRNINQNLQDAKDYYYGLLSGDNEFQKECKKVEYHNPKDLSWTQF